MLAAARGAVLSATSAHGPAAPPRDPACAAFCPVLPPLVQRTRASKEAATRIHKRGRANFCLTCLVMLVVGVAFAGERRARGGQLLARLPLRLRREPRPVAAWRMQRQCPGAAEAGLPPGCPDPAAMYVFIKVTRLAGYRAAAPTLAPAAPVPGGMEPGAPPEGVPTLEDHYAEL